MAEPPATVPEAGVTIVTGLEGPCHDRTPVTCSYCRHTILANDDHSVDCAWKRGKAVPR